MNKCLLLFANFYDSTTASNRIIESIDSIFDEINILYWARTGKKRNPNENIYNNINFKVFIKTAKPRSFKVFMLFVSFQYWLFIQILKTKPNVIFALTFYTVLPALFYKFVINSKCKVIYDPRDYISVSYRINILVSYLLRFIDNCFIFFSDLVIFPDKQYFIYYGIFNLSIDKYCILPNSSKDIYIDVLKNDIFEKYNIPRNKFLIPVLGYFSESRGRKIIFDLICKKIDRLHFIFAGDIREIEYLNFFKNNSDNVTFLEKIPYIDSLTIMKESLFVPQMYDSQSKSNIYAFPTKYYDCLMVGTPVVVSNGQLDVSNEIIENNFGFSIEYNDINALINCINISIENRNNINKENLRNYFKLNYDYNLYENVLRKKIIDLIS